MMQPQETVDDKATCDYVDMEEGNGDSDAPPANDHKIATSTSSEMSISDCEPITSHPVTKKPKAIDTTTNLGVIDKVARFHSPTPRVKKKSSKKPSRMGNNNQARFRANCKTACLGLLSFVRMACHLTLCFFVFLPFFECVVYAWFWWGFASTRGATKDVECDLQRSLDRYFVFGTIYFAVLLLGSSWVYCHYTLEPLRTREWTTSHTIVYTYILIMLYLGANATLWIPDDATCPETAASYFLSAKRFLCMQFSVCVVTVAIHLLLAAGGLQFEEHARRGTNDALVN